MHWHVRRLDQGRDEGLDWGPSTEYIEVDDQGWANRQVEIYDNGRSLKYDRTHWIDFHGELFDLPSRTSGSLETPAPQASSTRSGIPSRSRYRRECWQRKAREIG